MIFKTLVLMGLLGSNVAAESVPMYLRKVSSSKDEAVVESEHLDLEVVVTGGERQLFPLLPGTKCPTGHTCRARTVSKPSLSISTEPVISSFKENLKTPLAMAMDWNEFGSNIETIVVSDNICTRRKAMARAAGLAAGLSVAAVSQPAFGAETKVVKMGDDNGGLKFVLEKTTICKGDSVTWVNNKSGPHNVVFDEDAIPKGVSQEAISMEDQLGEEGETFTMKFEEPGDYAFYCEPHRGAGMNGMLIVTP
mmetsp:Transcript_28048/g.41733  ORF Transcript_28048/g.41733 Transcript_28048/m.41733 type:complete len:251 (-) Transcript_28048:29-781(-)